MSYSLQTYSGFYKLSFDGTAYEISDPYDNNNFNGVMFEDSQDGSPDGITSAGSSLGLGFNSPPSDLQSGTEAIYVGMSQFGPVIKDSDDYWLVTNTNNLQLNTPVTVNTTSSYPYCFFPGTLISTPSGEVAVDALRPGDLVLTADGRALPVRWIGEQTVATRFADPLRSLPVRIAAGALGHGLPRRDLLVSPGHAIGLGDCIAEAGALVNGASIRREARATLPHLFTWYHVELAEHALILAEGAPAESFVDSASPEHFDNAAQRTALLGEDVAPIPEMDLPRVRSARQLPRHARDQLTRIAAELGMQETQAA